MKTESPSLASEEQEINCLIRDIKGLAASGLVGTLEENLTKKKEFLCLLNKMETLFNAGCEPPKVVSLFDDKDFEP